jgi:signal transduction histidine kinase
MVCARVTDADVCMCAQEQVRRLTAENEALRRQLQEQQQLQRDASKEVRNVCFSLLHARLQSSRLCQLVQQVIRHHYLGIHLRSRNVRGRNHFVAFLDTAQEMQEEPAALVLNVVCLCRHA